ncbi:peptide chain release factor 1 [Roseomonas sp. GC11]|nr:peptide chain release factor 1 [Roseomonas sp. GC11]MCQ4158875.1 peptide chain release factor 1 [Roseomonas sp. GC11]
MSEREMEAKLVELDRLLNDPEVQMDPHRVWSLLQEISGAKAAPAAPRAA